MWLKQASRQRQAPSRRQPFLAPHVPRGSFALDFTFSTAKHCHGVAHGHRCSRAWERQAVYVGSYHGAASQPLGAAFWVNVGQLQKVGKDEEL